MLLIKTNGQEFNFLHLKDLNPFASLGGVTLIGNTPVIFFIILKDADAIQMHHHLLLELGDISSSQCS